jgi:hypothetical protein
MHLIRCFRCLFVVVLLFGGVIALRGGASSARAAPLPQVGGWFASQQEVVSPLQPVNVDVSVSNHTGLATLIVFDGNGQAAGSWEVAVPPGGSTTMQVVPRGAPGTHWAALFVGGTQVYGDTLYRLEVNTTLHTGVATFDQIYPRVRNFMSNATLSYPLGEHYVHGYRSPDSPLIWLRDHYYQGRGFRYFEEDVTSALDAFRQAQHPDGSFPDFLARPDHNISAYRTPVEADVEYLFVLAVYEAWKMTGNDAWLIANLEPMQRAINYTLTNPLRWEPSLGLVKRPYTIDTWDFEFGPTVLDPNTGQPAPRHWIDDRTVWGIFHGDNTGLVMALRALAQAEAYLGQIDNAHHHQDLANTILNNLNNLSWNGSFYTHHVKLGPWPGIEGVDEASQLSLSNALALNRGTLSHEQGRAVIEEYRTRLHRPGNVAFAEWWSIDPPFPHGNFGMGGRLGEYPGYYVNGGIMPLVGGELARGAFRYGYEAYGFDILRRYYNLIERTGATYLWYHPTGGNATGDHVLSTDGWGASAMLGGLMEGAAGVEDNGVRFSDVTLSPRWPAATEVISQAYVVAKYEASDSYVAYHWQHHREGGERARLKMNVTGTGAGVRLRLLLPDETPKVEQVWVNGWEASEDAYTIETLDWETQRSRYLVLNRVENGILEVEVALKR